MSLSYQEKLEARIFRIEKKCGKWDKRSDRVACLVYDGYYDLRRELETLVKKKSKAKLIVPDENILVQ